MKKKHVLMAISLGVAVGLYVGVNADLEKSNLSKVMNEVGKCVKESFGENEEARYDNNKEEKGIYKVKDSVDSKNQETILCENTICLPPSKRNG